MVLIFPQTMFVWDFVLWNLAEINCRFQICNQTFSKLDRMLGLIFFQEEPYFLQPLPQVNCIFKPTISSVIASVYSLICLVCLLNDDPQCVFQLCCYNGQIQSWQHHARNIVIIIKNLINNILVCFINYCRTQKCLIKSLFFVFLSIRDLH